jgi:inorganic pyrophosphatase
MIRNDRFLAVPLISREFEAVRDIHLLPPRFEKEINAFMKAYMEAEGKTIHIEGMVDAAAALRKL